MTDEEIIAIGKNVLRMEQEALLKLTDTLDGEFVKAVRLLHDTKGRVIVTGMGKSGHIARKIAATMASVGTPALFVHPAEASHGDLGMLTTDDIIVALSNSGESKELSDIIAYTKRFGLHLICIVGNRESTLARASDVVLCFPPFQEACSFGMAPTTSTTLSLAMGDALAMALMDLKGFSKDDYRERHPGGKLGALLLRASDLMASGEDMPVVKQHTLMTEAVVEISGKGLGCVGIVDDNNVLIGLITDGDLRRHMNVNLLSSTVDEIMTRNPKTIGPNILAVEAVRLMNEKKITNFFVIDEQGHPLGLLHLHRCLQAGVA